MRNALRSLWREPRAPDNPGTLWWDRWLVFGLVVSAILEGILRADVGWRLLSTVMAVALAFTLLWRRSHPLQVVAVSFGLVAVLNAVVLIGSYETFGLYTTIYILLLPYALLRWGSGREIMIGLIIMLIGFTTGIGVDVADVGEGVAAFVFAISPALLGATVRYRSYARSRDRDRAVLREREQLARELHDTVAHHVSAIAIQAQAGQILASDNPDAPRKALRVIEEEASRTLAEMRAIVGALRRGDEPELAPMPGIADIERLVPGTGEQPRVEVELSGGLDDITPAVDAAIYRLAQESITNALRHARHATSVEVSVSNQGQLVRLTVRDDGEAIHTGTEPGFGLIGMSERAKLLGGTLEAGPGPVRGWVVTAVIPKNGKNR
ncbi:MAG: sensor histidine kinase [Actinomycetota bacterium]|nr:sensor histidine kinase [Actinomycetota bacterium]